MKSTCNTCGVWAVRNAAFCWQCGHPIAATGHTFESAIGNGYDAPAASVPAKPQTPIWDKILRFGAVVGSVSVGSAFLGWPAELVPITGIGYVVAPTLFNWSVRFVGLLPKPKLESGSDNAATLRVEHVTEDKKHWLLYDFPGGIELKHIQWIAEQVVGEGMSFSRRNVCKPGKLSQGEFETIRDFWLSIHYAFYRDEAAPNRGLILSERCRRLLKKSQQITVVDGGGWLTSPSKSTLITAKAG